MIEKIKFIRISLLLQISEGLIEQAVFLIDCIPYRTAHVGGIRFLVVQQIYQSVITLMDFFIGAFLIIDAPFFVVLWTVNHFFLFHGRLLKAAENIVCERG